MKKKRMGSSKRKEGKEKAFVIEKLKLKALF